MAHFEVQKTEFGALFWSDFGKSVCQMCPLAVPRIVINLGRRTKSNKRQQGRSPKVVPQTAPRIVINFIVRPMCLSKCGHPPRHKFHVWRKSVAELFSPGRLSITFWWCHSWKMTTFLNVHAQFVQRTQPKRCAGRLGYTVEQEKRVSANKLTLLCK